MSTNFVALDENNLDRYSMGMMTPQQCRAARGWLDLSQDDLAKAASVSLSTVRDFEKGRRVPIQATLKAMEAALVGQGIEFLSKDGEAQGIAFVKGLE
jgi:DNA-binding transcriptional regulator YiaG